MPNKWGLLLAAVARILAVLAVQMWTGTEAEMVGSNGGSDLSDGNNDLWSGSLFWGQEGPFRLGHSQS